MAHSSFAPRVPMAQPKRQSSDRQSSDRQSSDRQPSNRQRGNRQPQADRPAGRGQPRHKQQVLRLVRQRGVLRPRDLDEYGIPREYLRRLCDEGLLERPGRGIYVATGAEPGANQTLAEACRRVPQGVICLLSALRFHDLTTQEPFEVWLAIAPKAWLPRVDYPPLRIVRFSGAALEFGIEQHVIEKVAARVYSPAKTVADCFKFRNKLGLDVALEALRDCWQQKRASMDQLWEAARVCRMTNVMRPYFEALA